MITLVLVLVVVAAVYNLYALSVLVRSVARAVEHGAQHTDEDAAVHHLHQETPR